MDKYKTPVLCLLALYAVSLWPFLNFINHNWGVMTWRILGYAHILFASGVLFAVLLHTIFYKVSFARWCFVISALIPVLFLYGAAFTILDELFAGYSGYEYAASERFTVNPAASTVYSILFCLAAWAVFRLSRMKDCHQLVGVLAAALVTLPLWGIAEKSLSRSGDVLVTAAFSTDKNFARKPNVYLIMMDGYPRSDVVKEVFGYDNSYFIKELENYGFSIQTKAQANYPNTHLSMSSTLMADYLGMDNNPLFHAKWHATVTGDNSSVHYFKAQGYKFILMESGIYALTKCVGLEDTCFSSPQSSISEHEYALLRQTPWAFLKGFLPLHWYLTETGANLGKLRDYLTAEKPAEPFFLFAHTVPPHAPYAYNRDCSAKEQFTHGYTKAILGQEEEFFEGYLDNIVCVNKHAIEFVQYVTETDPSAIVVLFSDHGSHFTMDWHSEKWSGKHIRERYSVMNAIRAPEACRQHLYDDMSNVNIMRFVFACLTETEPEYLEDKAYFSSNVPNAPHYGELVVLEEIVENDGESAVPDIVE